MLNDENHNNNNSTFEKRNTVSTVSLLAVSVLMFILFLTSAFSLQLTPVDPKVGDALLCVPDEEDIGNQASARYQFKVNEQTVQDWSGNREFNCDVCNPGDIVQCILYNSTKNIESNQAIVYNHKPIITLVKITDETQDVNLEYAFTSNDVLYCIADFSDADGGILDVTYDWEVLDPLSRNFVKVGEGIIYSGASVSDVIRCKVTVFDGQKSAIAEDVVSISSPNKRITSWHIDYGDYSGSTELINGHPKKTTNNVVVVTQQNFEYYDEVNCTQGDCGDLNHSLRRSDGGLYTGAADPGISFAAGSTNPITGFPSFPNSFPQRLRSANMGCFTNMLSGQDCAAGWHLQATRTTSKTTRTVFSRSCSDTYGPYVLCEEQEQYKIVVPKQAPPDECNTPANLDITADVLTASPGDKITFTAVASCSGGIEYDVTDYTTFLYDAEVLEFPPSYNHWELRARNQCGIDITNVTGVYSGFRDNVSIRINCVNPELYNRQCREMNLETWVQFRLKAHTRGWTEGIEERLIANLTELTNNWSQKLSTDEGFKDNFVDFSLNNRGHVLVPDLRKVNFTAMLDDPFAESENKNYTVDKWLGGIQTIVELTATDIAISLNNDGSPVYSFNHECGEEMVLLEDQITPVFSDVLPTNPILRAITTTCSEESISGGSGTHVECSIDVTGVSQIPQVREFKYQCIREEDDDITHQDIPRCQEQADIELTSYATKLAPQVEEPLKLIPNCKASVSTDLESIEIKIPIIIATGGSEEIIEDFVLTSDNLTIVSKPDFIEIKLTSTAYDNMILRSYTLGYNDGAQDGTGYLNTAAITEEGRDSFFQNVFNDSLAIVTYDCGCFSEKDIACKGANGDPTLCLDNDRTLFDRLADRVVRTGIVFNTTTYEPQFHACLTDLSDECTATGDGCCFDGVFYEDKQTIWYNDVGQIFKNRPLNPNRPLFQITCEVNSPGLWNGSGGFPVFCDESWHNVCTEDGSSYETNITYQEDGFSGLFCRHNGTTWDWASSDDGTLDGLETSAGITEICSGRIDSIDNNCNAHKNYTRFANGSVDYTSYTNGTEVFSVYKDVDAFDPACFSNVTGYVKNVFGVGVRDAVVSVYLTAEDGTQELYKQLNTSNDGSYSLGSIPSSIYQVSVLDNRSRGSAKNINLTYNSNTTLNFSISSGDCRSDCTTSARPGVCSASCHLVNECAFHNQTVADALDGYSKGTTAYFTNWNQTITACEGTPISGDWTDSNIDLDDITCPEGKTLVILTTNVVLEGEVVELVIPVCE